MRWIYSGTLPSLEDKTRYTAPPDVAEEGAEVAPREEGFEARVACLPRESNPYFPSFADLRAEWFDGWDEADVMEEEPDYGMDDILLPAPDCCSMSIEPRAGRNAYRLTICLARRLNVSAMKAEREWAMLKQDFRDKTLTHLPERLHPYLRALRRCTVLSALLERRAA